MQQHATKYWQFSYERLQNKACTNLKYHINCKIGNHALRIMKTRSHRFNNVQCKRSKRESKKANKVEGKQAKSVRHLRNKRYWYLRLYLYFPHKVHLILIRRNKSLYTKATSIFFIVLRLSSPSTSSTSSTPSTPSTSSSIRLSSERRPAVKKEK